MTVALERFFRIMGPFSSSVCGRAAGDAEDGFRSFRGWCRRFGTRRSNHVEGSPFVLFVDNLERGIEKSRCCLSLTHCSFTLCPLGLVDVEHGETLVCPTCTFFPVGTFSRFFSCLPRKKGQFFLFFHFY